MVWLYCRNTLNLDGSYLFGYETLDGQKREEEGKVSSFFS
jgi:hypothetical protein